MELTPKTQTVDLVKRSNKILIVSHGEDGDSLGSVLALKIALQKLNKEVVASVNFAPRENFSFLPQIETLQKSETLRKDFVISLDCSQVEVEKLGYRIEGDKLNIYITPKTGSINKNQIQFLEINPNFELIFVLDTPNLNLLGRLYESNTDLFYNTPVINLDHHPNNKFFGKINWVEPTAVATSEILVSLLEAIGTSSSLIDSEIATALLTGIISDTDSFQNPKTTSKSLTIAAQLIAAGAKREKIISQLFGFQQLSQLRLVGKALISLREDPEHKIAWTNILEREREGVEINPAQTLFFLESIVQYVPQAEILVIFWEQPEQTKVIIKPLQKHKVEELGSVFGTIAFHLGWLEFDLDKKLPEAEKEVLEKLKSYLKSKRRSPGSYS